MPRKFSECGMPLKRWQTISLDFRLVLRARACIILLEASWAPEMEGALDTSLFSSLISSKSSYLTISWGLECWMKKTRCLLCPQSFKSVISTLPMLRNTNLPFQKEPHFRRPLQLASLASCQKWDSSLSSLPAWTALQIDPLSPASWCRVPFPPEGHPLVSLTSLEPLVWLNVLPSFSSPLLSALPLIQFSWFVWSLYSVSLQTKAWLSDSGLYSE